MEMSAIGVPRASPRERGRSRRFQHPERLVAISFAVTILIGAGLLMLPWSTEAGDGGRFVDALFTSTSAVCVTGLTVVDTGSYWSEFGQFVIMLLIQVGGLGIMTLTALGLLVLGARSACADACSRRPARPPRRWRTLAGWRAPSASSP